MIERTAQTELISLAQGFPIVAMRGPRQSGKTTIARAVFPEKPYVSLENPEVREFADYGGQDAYQREGIDVKSWSLI